MHCLFPFFSSLSFICPCQANNGRKRRHEEPEKKGSYDTFNLSKRVEKNVDQFPKMWVCCLKSHIAKVQFPAFTLSSKTHALLNHECCAWADVIAAFTFPTFPCRMRVSILSIDSADKRKVHPAGVTADRMLKLLQTANQDLVQFLSVETMEVFGIVMEWSCSTGVFTVILNHHS